MIMTQRNRNGLSKKWCYVQGVGGRHCNCCSNASKHSPKVRRALRRIEKREWQREVL